MTTQGSLYAVALASKEYSEWLAEYVKSVKDELGYGGVRVALKHDNAHELVKLRTEVAARRSAPSVPIASPVKESKRSGAVKKAVRTWQGQFCTLKEHLDLEIRSELGPSSPVWTWCSWWAAALLNRVNVKTTGRTPYELSTGHRAKTPIVAFGEKVHWRESRARSGAGKYDSEWKYGIFLLVSGAEIVVGTPSGIKRSRDARRVPDDQCWDVELSGNCTTTFREYMSPAAGPQERFKIPVVHRDVGEVPPASFSTSTRRMMLKPEDFDENGFTAGCRSCIALQANKTNRRGGRHTEACGKRVEATLMRSPEGRI